MQTKFSKTHKNTKKPHISAVMATFNEENNITDCLESLKTFADEIIVVDGSSTDRTAEIAKGLGAIVYKTTNKTMFHINKNLAIGKSSGDWVFLIDADERVSKRLALEIVDKIKENPKENGFYVNRLNWFLGGFLKKGGAYPDSVIRLFRNGKGRLPEMSVHEQVKIEGEVGYLNNDLLHFADPNFSRYLKRFDRYTSQTAEELNKANPGKGIFQIIYYMQIKPLLAFLKIYFRHKGYQDGFKGFVWALFSGFHFFYAYVKYWEEK